MSKGEGYRRLTSGCKKSISRSEKERGYFFITLDKRALELLGKPVTLRIDNKIFKKDIDAYGRIFLGSKLMQTMPNKVTLTLNRNILDIS